MVTSRTRHGAARCASTTSRSSTRATTPRPPVRTSAWLAYDERYLYVAFRNDDPKPGAIRAPFVDRDQVLPDQDYDTMMLDTQNDRRSAQVFRVTARRADRQRPRRRQRQRRLRARLFLRECREDHARRLDFGDADSTRLAALSRYRKPELGRDPQQKLPARLPIHHGQQPLSERKELLRLLRHRTHGTQRASAWRPSDDWPYSTAAREEQWTGTRRAADPVRSDTGADFKWSASPALTIDATLNPDFSQIESDIPQVSVNSRFALSYPEKRAFFLEGTDLLATPMRVVYTRSITSPAWGIRATGQTGSTAYTLLAAEDRGGGDRHSRDRISDRWR